MNNDFVSLPIEAHTYIFSQLHMIYIIGLYGEWISIEFLRFGNEYLGSQIN